MQPSYQELIKSLPTDFPQLADGQILGLAKKSKRRSSEPSLTYQQAKEPNQSQIDKAFDILFEETLRKMSNLTSYDN